MNLEECSMEACSGRDSSSWKSGKTSRNKKTLKLPYWIKKYYFGQGESDQRY